MFYILGSHEFKTLQGCLCHGTLAHPNISKLTLFKAYVLKESWGLVASNWRILQLLRGNQFAVGSSGILGSLSGSDDEL